MGIHLEQGSTKFCIKVGDKAAALAAVKALADRTEAMGGKSGGVRHFSWVATEDFVQAATLEDALDAWGWEAVITEEAGDIDGLRHMGGKLGDEDTLFAALAPFVVSGSYIEARAEGDPFRWRFEQGQCFTDDGEVVYDPNHSARQALEQIHALLYADGLDTEWNADTLSAIADEVAKVIPRPGNAISPESMVKFRERLDSSRVDFNRLRRQRRTLRRVLERLAESDFTTPREDKDIARILHLLESF